MDSTGRMIVLFHKRLTTAGGAQRLLYKEYKYFRKLGYLVKIVTYRFQSNALYGGVVNQADLIELGDSYPMALVRLVRFMFQNREATYLCASGRIDLYLASLMAGVEYSLHIHRPIYMTFTPGEQYSFFHHRVWMRKKHESSEKKKLNRIKDRLSLIDKLIINVKAPFQIRAVKRARHIMVFSEFARREIYDIYHVGSHVVCGAIEDEMLSPQSAPHAHLPEVEMGKTAILCIARLDLDKRIDALIHAFSLFQKDNPDTFLFIGGIGSEYEDLRYLAKKFGVSDKVHFLGFIPDNMMNDYYASADLFIAIDFADYQITIFEALAMGTKVLASHETECEIALISSGWVHKAKVEPTSLAEAIRKALATPLTINRDGLNNILRNHTWETYCRKIVDILETPHCICDSKSSKYEAKDK